MGFLANKAARNLEAAFWGFIDSMNVTGLPKDCPGVQKLHQDAWGLALKQTFGRSGGTRRGEPALGDLEGEIKNRTFDELSERCGLSGEDWQRHFVEVKTLESVGWFDDIAPRWEAIKNLPPETTAKEIKAICDRFAFAQIPPGIHPGLDEIRDAIAQRLG